MERSLQQALPEDDLAGFEETYAQETHALLVHRTRIALSVGLVLYGAFWALDWIVIPDAPHADFGSNIWNFAVIRLMVVLLSLGTVAATYTEWGKRQVLPLMVGILTLASWGISLMSSLLGGWSSDYFIGNLLVLYFVGLFMPWSVGVTALFCTLMIAGYYGIILAMHAASTAMINPAFFLAGTCAYTLIAVHQSGGWRRREIASRLQLEQANSDLQSLDVAKTRFFANVSHELRTPLMLILGPLEALLSGRETGNPTALLKAMEANAQRLLRQVNMILNFASLEAGKLTLQPEPANMQAILDQLVAGALPYAEGRSIKLRTENLDELPDSMFDIEKIETVAANLLSNAMKFTPDGGKVTVRAGADEEAFWFEVEDTGRGIPHDQQELVFERFHQVEGDMRGKSQGTGLGLPLSRELVRLHGGDMSLVSEPDEGSCFRVDLPIRAVTGPKEDPGENLGRAASQTQLVDLRGSGSEHGEEAAETADPGAERILVVEDNDDLRAFLRGELCKTYRVFTASDGVEGLEKARRLRPDLIVSDWMMPNMTGGEMLQELRSDPACDSIPVMFLTARTGVDSVVEGLGAGAIDYLTKPFRLAELEARVAAQLRAREAESELDERNSRLVALGSMTSSIAHDLKGPLTVVSGRIGLLRMIAQENPELGDLELDLMKAEEANGRIIEMIGELGQFVRDGELRLDRSPCNFVDLVEDTLGGLEQSLDHAGVQLEVQTLQRQIPCELDQPRMRRVIENLVFNARDALAKDGERGEPARIRVEIGQEGEDVWLRVCDNGPGVPESLRQELFEPFTTTGKSHGTGLGLSIVRNIVAAHQGAVRHEGPGPLGGASFSLRMPGAPQHDEPPSLAAGS